MSEREATACVDDGDNPRFLPTRQRPAPALNGAQLDGPVLIDLRAIEARNVRWLDRPFLPAAELVTCNADGGTGKGLLSVHFAARVTLGEFGERRLVLFAVAEDAFDTVLKPRLLAAGADLAHVRCISWRRAGYSDAIRIPDDIPRLEQDVGELNAALLVIDPLLSHLRGRRTRTPTMR